MDRRVVAQLTTDITNIGQTGILGDRMPNRGEVPKSGIIRVVARKAQRKRAGTAGVAGSIGDLGPVRECAVIRLLAEEDCLGGAVGDLREPDTLHGGHQSTVGNDPTAVPAVNLEGRRVIDAAGDTDIARHKERDPLPRRVATAHHARQRTRRTDTDAHFKLIEHLPVVAIGGVVVTDPTGGVVLCARRSACFIEPVIERGLLQEWQQNDPPRVAVEIGGRAFDPSRRKRLLRRLMPQQAQPDLLEVVEALNLPGRLSSRLHRRQQQPHQHADDGDHHQQFHQREAHPRGAPAAEQGNRRDSRGHGGTPTVRGSKYALMRMTRADFPCRHAKALRVEPGGQIFFLEFPHLDGGTQRG